METSGESDSTNLRSASDDGDAKTSALRFAPMALSFSTRNLAVASASPCVRTISAFSLAALRFISATSCSLYLMPIKIYSALKARLMYKLPPLL